ncbi:unnamed protein product, partial [Mesorhabditis belari]|uniref:RING-type domain-containing protein n=1 Tax=Mesorhabditis belari TaxID=2138241 RepID=A0AAF3FBJ3_9BILA
MLRSGSVLQAHKGAFGARDPEPKPRKIRIFNAGPWTTPSNQDIELSIYSNRIKTVNVKFKRIVDYYRKEFQFYQKHEDLLYQMYQHVLQREVIRKGNDLEWKDRIEALEKLEKRLDFIYFQYLPDLLQKELLSRGIPKSVYASLDIPEAILTLNFQLHVRRNGDYWRIDGCSLVRLIYEIPLFLLNTQKVLSLWFSTKTRVVYTSPFPNPSEEQKKHVISLWSSEPSSRNEATPKPVHKSSPQIDHGTQTEENLEIVNDFNDETNHFPENSTIDKILLCSVCLKQFSSDQYPVTLIPCGHSMCESCWDKDECFNCLVCGQRIKSGVFSKTLLHFVQLFEAQPLQLINEETNNEEEIAENEVLSMENEEIVKPLKEKKFDKAKLCITGLPKDFTVNDVVNGLFERSNGIAHCDGRPVVSLRVTDDDKWFCIAYFNSKKSAGKAKRKCDFHLREKSLADATVDFLEITEENEDLICDPVKMDEESALNWEPMIKNSTVKDEAPNAAVDVSVLNKIEFHIKPTKDLNKRKLFISGLPREYREYHFRNELFSDVELVTQNDKLQILLMDTGVAQNCVVELKNEIDAKKMITRWNAQIMENGRRLLVEYYGKDFRDFRENYALIARAPIQPVELPKAQNGILKTETGSSAPTSSKSETPQSSASTSKASTNWTNLAICPENMTKSALFISGLPKGSSEKEILETYLNGGKDIMKEGGRYKMITKRAGDGVNCIVYFQKKDAARQIITKWSNKAICGNSRLLVEYFGISKRDFGINYGPMIYENSKKAVVNNSDPEENCRIRITRIPFGFTENFIIQTLDQKTIDGVYVYIRMVNGKNLLEFTPATGESALNGQCIVTLNTRKAAQTVDFALPTFMQRPALAMIGTWANGEREEWLVVLLDTTVDDRIPDPKGEWDIRLPL